MVENLVASGSIEGITGAKSWQQYLEETNPELAEWARSYNPYDYTKAGTNEGTFKTLTGRSSTDFDWSPLERINKTQQLSLKQHSVILKTHSIKILRILKIGRTLLVTYLKSLVKNNYKIY